jgi:hypothetical protein
MCYSDACRIQKCTRIYAYEGETVSLGNEHQNEEVNEGSENIAVSSISRITRVRLIKSVYILV